MCLLFLLLFWIPPVYNRHLLVLLNECRRFECLNRLHSMQYQPFPAGVPVTYNVKALNQLVLLQVPWAHISLFPFLGHWTSFTTVINSNSSAASSFNAAKATCASSGSASCWIKPVIRGTKGIITFVLSSTTRRPSADTHNTARTGFFPACKHTKGTGTS